MQAAGVEKRIVAPDIHQQGFHRHDLARIPAEVLQHFGFAGRKFRHHAVAREPLALGVETHTPQFEHTFRTRFPDARTPGKRPDPHDQLAHGKGLAQVIVAPGLESLHHVLGRRARRKEKHRHPGRLAAQTPDEGEPVHTRHHNIRHDHIGARPAERPQPGLAVVGHRHLEPLFGKGIGDDPREGLLVLYEQQPDLIAHRPELSG